MNSKTYYEPEEDYTECEPESDAAIAERQIEAIAANIPKKSFVMKAFAMILGSFSLYFDYLNSLALGLMYLNMKGDSLYLAYGKGIAMSFIIEVVVFFLGCVYNNNPDNKHKSLIQCLFVGSICLLVFTGNALYRYYSWQADPDSAIYSAANKEKLAQNLTEAEGKVRAAEEVVASAQRRLAKLHNDSANFESLHRNDSFEDKERARNSLNAEIQSAAGDVASARADVTSIRVSGEVGARSFMDQDREFRRKQKEMANNHQGFADQIFGGIVWDVIIMTLGNFASSFFAGYIAVIGKEVSETVMAMRRRLFDHIVQ